MLLLRVGSLAFLLAAPCFAAAAGAGADPGVEPVSECKSAPVVAASGPDSSVLVGQRVRVRYQERDHESVLPFLRIPYTRRGELVGEVVGVEARELHIRTETGDGAEVIVAAARIVSIERSVGRRRATVTGLRTGALLGLCITPLVWYGEGQGDDDVDWLRTAAWTTGGCAAVGALWGALGREDIWEQVERGTGFSLVPEPHGVAVLVTLQGSF